MRARFPASGDKEAAALLQKLSIHACGSRHCIDPLPADFGWTAGGMSRAAVTRHAQGGTRTFGEVAQRPGQEA